MKELTKELREELLRKFCAYDQNRPIMNHIMAVEWLDQKWVCTTNGCAAILIKDQGDIPVETEQKTVNVRGVLPDQVAAGHELPSELRTKLLDLPMITRKARMECAACDGEGMFDRHGESYECRTCDQIGYLESSLNETIPDPDCYLRIGGVYLAMDRWVELKLCIRGLQTKEVRLLSQEKKNLIFFQFDEDIILMMAGTYFGDMKDVRVVDLGFGEEVSDDS